MWREIKEPLDEGEGEWKSWLKTQCSKNEDHGIQFHHFMANRWEKVEAVTDFIFLGFKITVDGNCSHEINRFLLLGRKSMTNLDCILKNRDVTLPTKVGKIKAIIFPVVMYRYLDLYGPTMKVEHWRIDAFEFSWWRRLLRVPSTAMRSNQSIPQIINLEYSLDWLMLKLKLQYSDYLMQRAESLEKTLMLGKIEGRRRSGWLRMRWLDGISNSVAMSLRKLWQIGKDREAWPAAVHGIAKSQISHRDWTTTRGYSSDMESIKM